MEKDKKVKTIMIYINQNQKEKLEELLNYKIQGVSGILRTALELYYSTIKNTQLDEDAKRFINVYKIMDEE